MGKSELATDVATLSLPADLLVPASKSARRVATALVLGFVFFAIVSLAAPWQQTVPGVGQVVAYAPEQRQQSIDATIAGRVANWFVQEGSEVSAGDPIVRLVDNDAEFMNRLETERTAAELRLSTQESRVTTLIDRVRSLERSRTAQSIAADADIQVAREELLDVEQQLMAAQAELETNQMNYRRQKDLKDRGLASVRDYELSDLALRRSESQVRSAEASLRGTKSKLAARRAMKDRIVAAADADVESAQASLSDAEGAVAEAQGRLARMSVEIARQEQQIVAASTDGTILRILVRMGGEQISRGQSLALIVPKTEDRAVALEVDGNDAALIRKGKTVRLQFEGWPAVQFSGWPSVAVGTFGGKVAFVDAAGDGMGNFRVVVVPDPRDEPWPHPKYLRQGIRAKGWFLLDRVTLGFEIWRRFNGFPPAIQRPDDEKDLEPRPFPAASGVVSGGTKK